jgi:hypothetical protein
MNLATENGFTAGEIVEYKAIISLFLAIGRK